MLGMWLNYADNFYSIFICLKNHEGQEKITAAEWNAVSSVVVILKNLADAGMQ